MNAKSLEFLKQLMATPTPSGYEHDGQRLVAEWLGKHCAEVRRDTAGNVTGVLNPYAPFRVMLAGHCDEIGIMVQHIDDKGYVYVSAVGGVYVPLLQGERVVIQSRKGPVHGVIGVKPIHLMTEKERESAPSKMHELWVDIGATDRKDAEKAVRLGDVGVVNSGWTELRNGLVAARAFDDRVGAFVVAEAARLLSERKLKVGVYAVSTVQEEIGLRGAKLAAFGIDPHVGIAVDVGFATDFPNAEAKIVGEARLGKGPILHRGPTYNHRLFDHIEKTAERAKLHTQLQPESRGASTDAYAIQMNRAGVPAALISVPVRYMHSAVETASVKDIEASAELLAESVARLTGREDFCARP